MATKAPNKAKDIARYKKKVLDMVSNTNKLACEWTLDALIAAVNKEIILEPSKTVKTIQKSPIKKNW